ncbi:hypothetical protein CYY_004410 [Polysphondylium violaceum]|uniref:Rho-GAP domain-containing protein n=1 Tax=Polysphondylium violaceum TaxID=133409 RepID=A0A8J4PWR7_9MYCE|nr:hypothetical protein CYY_004410 [Polysphondylium violaceum]
MKKINRAYGEAKVSLSAMINKDVSPTEIPEYIAKVNSIQGIKYFSKDILNGLSKQSKSNQVLIEENAQLGETLIEYGSWYGNSEGGACDSLGNLIKVFGDLHVQMEVCRSKLDIAVANRLHNQMNEFMKNDIKDAFLAKNRYDKSRITFDAASETFKTLRKKPNVNQDKLSDAEQELDYATQQFSDVSTESLYRMEDIVEKYNEEMFDSVYDIIKQYKEYFDKGTEIINQILPEIDQHKKSMAKYKQSMNERKSKRANFVVFEQSNNSNNSSNNIQISSPPPIPTSKYSINSNNNNNNNNNNDNARGSRSSMVALKVFGVPLQVVVDRENRDTPMIVDKAIEYLEKNIKTEGLFRISPNQKTLLEVKQLANTGSIQSFDINYQYDDAHLVSSFLKAYLREMPVPLFTFELYKKITDCVLDDQKDKESMAKSLSEILKQLPYCNLILVKKLFALLYSISVESKINKMNTSNLAVVLAPNILYPKQLDIQAISNSNAAVEFMISQYILIFKPLEGIPAVERKSSELKKSNDTAVLPPRLPTRPASVMFKQSPLNNDKGVLKSQSSSSIAMSPPPLPPKSNRLSVSTSTLMSPPASSTPPPSSLSSSSSTITNPTTPSPPPLSPVSSPPSTPVINNSNSNNKPINNRVSVYLSNFNQQHQSNSPSTATPTPPPKPSRYSVMIPTTKNNINNNDLPPPLAPLPSSSNSSSTASPAPSPPPTFKKRPQPLKVEQGKSVVKDGVKISHSLLDDSVSYSPVTDNYDYTSSDSFYDW